MSRLTFREAVDVCWQKQLRDRYLEEGTPPVPHLSVKRARIRPVSRKLAEQVILKYEWLGTMANSSRHYGIFFGSYCAGVTCVAQGSGTAGTNVHKVYHVEGKQVTTLVRGACVHWAPTGTNSKLVSWTCRLLADTGKHKVITAYADTDAGEIGTIYQACNWHYIGRGAVNGQIVAPTGRVYDQRCIYEWAKKARCSWARMKTRLLDDGWHWQNNNPKHRYVQILDKSDAALVARVERMRQPYPKRADEATQ